MSGGATLLEHAIRSFPESSALRLRKALIGRDSDARQVLGQLPIPDYRKWLYEGHLSLARREYVDAAAYYSRAVSYENLYVSQTARRHLYAALYADGQFAKALDLVVDHCLSQPGAHRLYPLEELANAVQAGSARRRNEVGLSILLQLAARYVHPRWERDLSDAYENALNDFSVDTPSKLIASAGRVTIPATRLTFFLRYVCVPRILDDSTAFSTVTEVETERIRICQFLSDFDPPNGEVYASEIRAITRDAQVAQLLAQIESSKIYVDEEGLKSAFHDKLSALFERHQILLRSPPLEYQAEQLAKRLKELVRDKKAPIDLKNLHLPASERESLFTSILVDFIDQFTLNPAYGLKIHLSTSIRHGVFEGHVRAPFAAEHLLCSIDPQSNRHVAPSAWARIDGVDDDEQDFVQKQLIRFTQRVETLVKHWLDDLLRVREAPGNTEARFDFRVFDDELEALRESITAATTYAEFLDRLFSFCWTKVDESMVLIRHELDTELRVGLTSAIDTLVASLEARISHNRIQRLIDASVRAKTSAQASVDTIREWFKRPSDLLRSPFDIDLAIRVALKQIQNCYVHIDFRPTIHIDAPSKIAGDSLDGIVEIFFLLFQNVIRHSGFPGSPEDVEVFVRMTLLQDCENSRLTDTLLIISVRNRVHESVDVSVRRILIAEAQQRYEHDSAMRLAGREGGSGLSKVWRTLQFDLNVQHRLGLSIDDSRFSATLDVNGIRTC